MRKQARIRAEGVALTRPVRGLVAAAAGLALAVGIGVPVVLQQEATALDNGLAQTPAMGWNSWNQVRCYGLNEELVKATADAMASNGTNEAGYEYVVVDDCFQGGQRPRDRQDLLPPRTFPQRYEGAR